jgi:hypothetical protein
VKIKNIRIGNAMAKEKDNKGCSEKLLLGIG